ncbi:MAG: glycosyltransferase, partial [Alphaproteobacteria bacterium]
MKISIIIPTRNRAEFLKYCLATCLLSTDPDLEVVVSDNFSVDDTK